MKIKHGFNRRSFRHPLYKTWLNMKTRCVNPKRHTWKNYGGRGISLCAKWFNDPKAFITWALDHGWKPGLTIERKNNNAGYSPGNCTWIPPSKQQRNAQRTKLTETTAKAIRKHLNQGVRASALAIWFGVSKQTYIRH